MDIKDEKFKNFISKKEGLKMPSINATNLKVSQMTDGSPMVSTDVIPFIRDVSGTWTNFKAPISALPGSYDPFDAKVNNFTEFMAAITAGKWCINVAGNITFTQNFQLPTALTRPIVIYLSRNTIFNIANYQFDLSQNIVLLKTDTNGVLNYFSTTAKSPLISTGGLGGVLYIDRIACGNGSTSANTPLTDGNTVLICLNRASFTDNGLANSGINLVLNGSSLDNFALFTNSNVATSSNILTMANGTYVKGIRIYNLGNSTNNLITIQQDCSISQLVAYINPILITNQGVLHAVVQEQPVDVVSDVSSQISDSDIRNLTITGNKSVQNAVDFSGNITINSGVSYTRFIGCDCTGTYTDNGTSTMGVGNTGSIPNSNSDQPAILVESGPEIKISAMTDGVSFNPNDKIAISRSGANVSITQQELLASIPSVAPGIGPFDSTLDNAGILPNHYVNFGAAYTAAKPYTYTIANITESGNVTFLSTEQGYIQVGQNLAWDLAQYQIIGSAANSFTIDLSDGSAFFKYAMTGTNIPFSTFDINSTLVLQGNGGTFQNLSAVPNTYITVDGTLLASDIYFLLPNASGGGFKTNLYTVLRNIDFIGGGVNCDTALISNGGKCENIIFSDNNGTWKDNAFLNDNAGGYTVYDTVVVDINNPVVFKLNGSAINVLTNDTKTNAFLSVSASTNSILTHSDVDAVVLETGTTDVKVGFSNVGQPSFAVDNTTQADFIGVTFSEQVQIYGNCVYVNCHFNGGVEAMSGCTAKIVGCDSVTALVNSGATSLIRVGNDSNVGNDAIAKNIREITNADSPFSALVNDLIVADTSGGDITILLPLITSENSGRDIYVSSKGSGTVDFTPAGSNTILGLSTKSLTGNGSAYTFAAISNDWRIF